MLIMASPSKIFTSTFGISYLNGHTFSRQLKNSALQPNLRFPNCEIEEGYLLFSWRKNS
jgi:hypothetical protein